MGNDEQIEVGLRVDAAVGERPDDEHPNPLVGEGGLAGPGGPLEDARTRPRRAARRLAPDCSIDGDRPARPDADGAGDLSGCEQLADALLRELARARELGR
jgi:hypothetical protein